MAAHSRCVLPVAQAAGRYLLLLTPALFMLAASSVVDRYLTCQRVVVPTLAANALMLAASPLVYWLLLFRWAALCVTAANLRAGPQCTTPAGWVRAH